MDETIESCYNFALSQKKINKGIEMRLSNDRCDGLSEIDIAKNKKESKGDYYSSNRCNLFADDAVLEEKTNTKWKHTMENLK